MHTMRSTRTRHRRTSRLRADLLPLPDTLRGGIMRTCRHCGVEIPAEAHKQKMYCTKECKAKQASALSKERYRAAHPVDHQPCQHCGGVIPEGKRRGSKYCSKKCYWGSGAGRAKERRHAEPKPFKPCGWCGEAIPSGRWMYCSDRCMHSYHNRTYLARRADAEPVKRIRYGLDPALARFMASRSSGAEARRFIQENKMKVGK